jgi:hypothetical protein
VSNMLKVAARELGDPVILGVEVKSRNGLLHRPSLGERCSWSGAFGRTQCHCVTKVRKSPRHKRSSGRNRGDDCE